MLQGALAVWAAWRIRTLHTTLTTVWVAVALALVVRAPLLGTPWLLSDDGWRYLWEGAVLAAGHNPFSHPPLGLPQLDPELLARVNHPDVPSVYPPLALVWFRMLHALGGTPMGAQVATGMADLCVVGLLGLNLRARHAPVWPAWLYALHPLPALESASSAHLEAPALALVGLGLLALTRPNGTLGAWVGLGAAALFKLLPGLALPAAGWR